MAQRYDDQHVQWNCHVDEWAFELIRVTVKEPGSLDDFTGTYLNASQAPVDGN